MIDILSTSTMTIERKVVTHDNDGSYNQTWSDFATDIPCRLEYVGGDLTIIEQRRGFPYTHLLKCDSDVVINEITDRIVINSIKYQIQHIERPIDTFTAFYLNIFLLEIKNENLP